MSYSFKQSDSISSSFLNRESAQTFQDQCTNVSNNSFFLS